VSTPCALAAGGRACGRGRARQVAGSSNTPAADLRLPRRRGAIALTTVPPLGWPLWRAASPSPARRIESLARTLGAANVAIRAALWNLAIRGRLRLGRRRRLHVRFSMSVLATRSSSCSRGSVDCWSHRGLSSSSTFDIGDRVVAPVPRERESGAFDTSSTHGDPHHIAEHLIQGVPASRSMEDSRPAVRATHGIVWRRRAPGAAANVLTAGDGTDVDVSTWLPSSGPRSWERQKVRNDNSIVLELRWTTSGRADRRPSGKRPETHRRADAGPSRLRSQKYRTRQSHIEHRTLDSVRPNSPSQRRRRQSLRHPSGVLDATCVAPRSSNGIKTGQ